MKSERGITITALVIYIMVATVVIATMSMVSSFFFSNMNLVKGQDQYAVEFNKFNMFFIEDVKNNTTAQVQDNRIVFEDNTVYEYRSSDKAIYRNDKKIAKEIMSAEFTPDIYTVNETTKNLITVSLTIGKNKNYEKSIEYVLKYW